jgi:hypothetical protein
MLKQVIRVPQIPAAWDQGWLDVDKAASVEVSSENENYPIESALLGDEKRGWRAAGPGSQTIRLIFDSPQRLRRIFLAFEDSEVLRTQEFVLRWSLPCWTAVPGNRAPAVEFQLARRSP